MLTIRPRTSNTASTAPGNKPSSVGLGVARAVVGEEVFFALGGRITQIRLRRFAPGRFLKRWDENQFAISAITGLIAGAVHVWSARITSPPRRPAEAFCVRRRSDSRTGLETEIPETGGHRRHHVGVSQKAPKRLSRLRINGRPPFTAANLCPWSSPSACRASRLWPR